MNFTPKVHHSSEIFFLCQDISWAQLKPWPLGGVSGFWSLEFDESSTWHHWGKNAAMPFLPFEKNIAVGWFFSGHSQSPDLRLQSVQMHFTQKSYVKRNQEEIDYDECFYWRRSTWKSSHANALVQVGHCLKDNQSCAVGIPCLGRGYGAVVVTMLMSRPLLEDLAMFRRDLFRNKPCNKPEMPGGSEWNCPKRRSSLCVGILEIMRVLISRQGTGTCLPRWFSWSSISFALATFWSHLRTPWGYRSTWELQHPSFRISDQSVLTDLFDWDFHGLKKAFCIHWNNLWTNCDFFFRRFIKFTRHIISDEDGEPTQMLVWCLDDGTTWRRPRGGETHENLLITGCECCRGGARQQYREGLDCSKCLFVWAIFWKLEIPTGWFWLEMFVDFFRDFL